jgi:hypothetical protein
VPVTAGILVIAVGVVLMLGLSHPRELRPWRWLRIAVSIPVLAALGWFFDQATPGLVIPMVACVIVFGLIWLKHFTWFGAALVHGLIHGPQNQGGGGFVPDYRGARSRVEDGDYELAIEHVKFELAKEPGNFEGLWLLAAIYQELKRPTEARQQIDAIIACPTSTPEQVATARAAQQQLRLLEIQLANEREGK